MITMIVETATGKATFEINDSVNLDFVLEDVTAALIAAGYTGLEGLEPFSDDDETETDLARDLDELYGMVFGGDEELV